MAEVKRQPAEQKSNIVVNTSWTHSSKPTPEWKRLMEALLRTTETESGDTRSVRGEP